MSASIVVLFIRFSNPYCKEQTSEPTIPSFQQHLPRNKPKLLARRTVWTWWLTVILLLSNGSDSALHGLVAELNFLEL